MCTSFVRQNRKQAIYQIHVDGPPDLFGEPGDARVAPGVNQREVRCLREPALFASGLQKTMTERVVIENTVEICSEHPAVFRRCAIVYDMSLALTNNGCESVSPRRVFGFAQVN